MAELGTARLLLRRWREEDLEPFAALNADPEAMRYFPSPMTRHQSDVFALHVDATLKRRGWGLWAVEVVGQIPFIGFIGLNEPGFEAHFTPAVEVGWRLVPAAWGKGYATEGARAAIAYGFESLGLDEIVSFTSVVNARSWRVMERLGMRHDSRDDFDHPAIASSSLRRHVLYRIAAGDVAVAP
jgi:RimJ/RimL family protein N-acetyltransferase